MLFNLISRSEIGNVKGEDFRRLVEKGVPWVVKQGFGSREDVERTEEHGRQRSVKAARPIGTALVRRPPARGPEKTT